MNPLVAYIIAAGQCSQANVCCLRNLSITLFSFSPDNDICEFHVCRKVLSHPRYQTLERTKLTFSQYINCIGANIPPS